MKCPFCGSEEGYYMKEIVHRFLYFTFDGEPNGASEDITDFAGKRRFCANCQMILPKKMFKEE
nr:MAG TPA: ISL3 zinc-finger of transposase IS204/IS1001/IS1096/IS1165 [Bacteriophage sp.]